MHSYPHCWRCDTPLLNYAATSWFVKVTAIKDKLLSENKKIRWVPEDIRGGRFGKWLEGAPDWAISRLRYWGAPLPVWKCEKCEKATVVGSVAELRARRVSNRNHYIVVRHGQGQHKELGINSSKVDHPHHLTEAGKAQIKDLARTLSKRQFAAVYSSPFVRTRETADLIAEGANFPKEQIVIDERLRELDFGDLDLKPYADFLKFEEEEMHTYDVRI